MSDLQLMAGGIWVAPQGEGLLWGTPSVFLRLAGCDLRCDWCDTKDSLPDYDIDTRRFKLPVSGVSHRSGAEDIAIALTLEAQRSGVRHVVVTGGEPILQSVALDLMMQHCDPTLHFTIETNGETHPEQYLEPTPPRITTRVSTPELVSVSPKVARYRQHGETQLEVISRWSAKTDVQVKIVVASKEDVSTGFVMAEAIRNRVRASVPTIAFQVEYSWMKRGWLPKEERDGFYCGMAERGIRLWMQTHKPLGVL